MTKKLISVAEAMGRGWFIGHEVPWGQEIEVHGKRKTGWVVYLPGPRRWDVVRADAFEDYVETEFYGL